MWTHALGRRGGYGAAFDETEKAKGAARLFDVWKRMLEVKYEHTFNSKIQSDTRGSILMARSFTFRLKQL